MWVLRVWSCLINQMKKYFRIHGRGHAKLGADITWKPSQVIRSITKCRLQVTSAYLPISPPGNSWNGNSGTYHAFIGYSSLPAENTLLCGHLPSYRACSRDKPPQFLKAAAGLTERDWCQTLLELKAHTVHLLLLRAERTKHKVRSC